MNTKFTPVYASTRIILPAHGRFRPVKNVSKEPIHVIGMGEDLMLQPNETLDCEGGKVVVTKAE